MFNPNITKVLIWQVFWLAPFLNAFPFWVWDPTVAGVFSKLKELTAAGTAQEFPDIRGT